MKTSSLEESDRCVTALNDCKYLFISSIREIEELTLEIFADEAKPQEPISVAPYVGEIGQLHVGARPIETDNTCRSFQLVFPRNEMVLYQVLNESYGRFPKAPEMFSGSIFRTFSRSHLLDFVKCNTHASDEYPGILHHYQLVAENHVMDVIMTGQPEILMDSQRIAARYLAMMGGTDPNASVPPRRRYW